MIINITGSPPAAALLRNTAQGDNSKRFTDFDERVSDEMTKFSDDDKLRYINDLNNPAYTLAPSNKPFEPIKNTDRSEANIVSDKKYDEVKASENKQLSKEEDHSSASSGTNNTDTRNAKKDVISEPDSSNNPSEKPQNSKKTGQMANINNQDAAPKLIISQKAEKSSAVSIDNPIRDINNSSLSKSITTENAQSLQLITKEGKENSSEETTIQETFRQLNSELQNSANHSETKEVSRFNAIDKNVIDTQRTVQENQVKTTEQNEKPVKESSPKDGRESFSENPDLNQNGNKARENKTDAFQSAVSFGNISKAYQKGSASGLISPLPAQKLDISEISQRTLQMVKTIPGNGTTSAKLILSPPALGSLHIDISLKADHVRMSIKADNQDTMKMIENQIGALRDKLAENGLKTEKIELSYRNENQEKQLDAGQEKQRRNEEDKKLRRDFPRTFQGNQYSVEEGDSQLTYIPSSVSHISQRNLTGV